MFFCYLGYIENEGLMIDDEPQINFYVYLLHFWMFFADQSGIHLNPRPSIYTSDTLNMSAREDRTARIDNPILEPIVIILILDLLHGAPYV